MSTFDQLADATILDLYGYTQLQDQATHLTANVSSTASAFPVADTTAVSRGTIEIGDELVWVDDVDLQNSRIVIAPYGRGFRGTTAAGYSAGTRIVSSPMFPRARVKQALNDAILAVYPDLHGVGVTEFLWNPSRNTYPLTDPALDILSVTHSTVGPSKEWLPCRRYRLDRNANTTEFTSGASISIYERITPGRTVKVVYAKQPVRIGAGDDFSDTGLPASSEDVIRLGAQYRLIPMVQNPQLSGMSAEADFAARQNPIGSATTIGRYILQMYQVRLAEESRRQRALYNDRSHYTR
jgi:hypothetical protein